ncbi:MAG: hypothetical protein JOZ41_21490, partial [Chloroflexi bacterium]|nr:hypothetical protein [Chloroflexota bacterium]
MSLHIRPGMDVYSAYQDEYIGSVVGVWQRAEPAGTAEQRGAGARETGSAPESARQNPDLTHEEGAGVDPTRHMGKKELGEEMGP